jgi:hypothetical protein
VEHDAHKVDDVLCFFFNSHQTPAISCAAFGCCQRLVTGASSGTAFTHVSGQTLNDPLLSKSPCAIATALTGYSALSYFPHQQQRRDPMESPAYMHDLTTSARYRAPIQCLLDRVSITGWPMAHRQNQSQSENKWRDSAAADQLYAANKRLEFVDVTALPRTRQDQPGSQFSFALFVVFVVLKRQHTKEIP